MEYYEMLYRKMGLWEEMTKGMVDIDEYHKSKKYQALSSAEKSIMDKEIEEINRVIKSQIAFYPYEYKPNEEYLKIIYGTDTEEARMDTES